MLPHHRPSSASTAATAAISTAATSTASGSDLQPQRHRRRLGPRDEQPGGIDCGSDCGEGYASGTSVTLTAVPTGTVPLFVAWAGACTGTGGCIVTMTGDQTVTAIFGP